MTVRDKLIAFLVGRYIGAKNNRCPSKFDGIILERIDPGHPLSGLRIARYLRMDGLIDFCCVSRNKSQYEVTSINLRLISEDLRKRKAKWTRAELEQMRFMINNAYITEGEQAA
jgi:hypothetical protein